MIYIYRRTASEGASELAWAVSGRKVSFFENGTFMRRLRRGAPRVPVTLTAQDTIVCWGSPLSGAPRNVTRILNNAQLRTKYDEALALREANVPTIEVSNVRPNRTQGGPDPALHLWAALQETAEEITNLPLARTQVVQDGLVQLVIRANEVHRALQTPLPPAQEWLPRMNDHVGGNDLLTRPTAPNYWSKKEDIREEFRIHSFLGRSIRAGVKQPREGFANPNPWIRSYEGGWFINYNGFESTREMRELARNAVRALGLDFGAVDIGRKADGTFIVLEVNRAPGLEGGTVDSYAEAIRKYVTGEWTWENFEAPAPRPRARVAA